MDTNIDYLKSFLEHVKTIGVWGRLFRWKSVKQKLVDAAGDLQKLVTNIEYLKEQSVNIEGLNSALMKDVKIANENAIRKEIEIERFNAIFETYNIKNIKFERDLSSRDTTIGNQQEKINTIEGDVRVLAESIKNFEKENKKLLGETATNGETIVNLSNRKNELDIEIAKVRLESKAVGEESDKLKQQNIQLLKDDEFRKQGHSNAISSLVQIREQIQNDRAKEMEDRNNVELERIKKLRETWSNHQENVKNVIKTICSKHTIEYVDKVPFRGEPDNTLRICDEFIILDAKSPGSEDLSNFSNYLREQAERAKKYSKEEAVKKDIFFVVPSNTLDKLQQFVFRLADYNVYIVSVDSLEPLILSLQKLEEYEFAEQLSPEERENICRVLGKFAHLTKRRIQIDSFFIKQFMELAYKCESDLPPDILEKVVEFEKAEKLNPPTERRSKQISLKELEKDTTQLRNETRSKGIVMVEEIISTELNKLPLYNDEANGSEVGMP